MFDLVTGSTTSYVTPPGFKSQLVKTGSGWTLTENSSQDQQKFDSSGTLVSRQDRNGNLISITSAAGANGFSNLTVTTPAGPSMARTATVVTDTYDTTTVRQDIYSEVRSVSFSKVYSNLSSFTDALGRGTSFGYDSSGLLTSISAPGSVKTAFGYDSSRRVSSITQTETTTGGPGSSVTRLAYPSATQTLLADPNTDQALAVSAVPRTTYTIDSSQRVTQAVDAAGRTRSKAYTANFDTQSSTVGGAGGSTTTNTYGANSGQSLTKTTSPTGASASLSYANPAGPTQFLPTSGSDDAGNAGTFTYNGAGNPLTSSDALAAKASLTRNADGTVATATAPGNGSNATRYGYTNKQTTSTTPVTGSSLAARAYTYDAYGRLATATNGRGVTTTYTYDRLDRVTAVAYTGATTVNYGYDTAGRSSTRTDAAGTATWAYDQLGRLTSRANTVGGGTITYTYDKASRLTTLTSVAGGTTTYSYDAAGEPTVIAYPHQNGTTAYLRFATDSKGRRTDAWMQSNADHTTWAAHNRVEYDNSGRASRVIAELGPGDTNKTAVVDTSYCYVAGTTAPACTANTAGDRAKLQWKRDNLNGQTTTYTYDKAGRLTKATVTGTGATTFAYSYNSNGNRLTANTQTLSYNQGNQITSTGYTYDGAGNTTADPSAGAVAYTPMDQMKTVTRGASTYSYTYGGTDTNELLAQTTPNGAYTYTYGRTSPQGVPMIESGSRDGLTASVLSDPVTGQPLMLRTSSGAQSLYVYDGTPGSPIALITSSAYVAFAYDYDPFGVPTLTKDSGGTGRPENPYTFAGGLQDRTTGWVHFGNRYYNAKTGSFTQQDALDAPLDPVNANRYAYAGNDPINNTDPTGRDAGACAASVFLTGVSIAAFEATIFVGAGATALSRGTAGPWAVAGAYATGLGALGCLSSLPGACGL